MHEEESPVALGGEARVFKNRSTSRGALRIYIPWILYKGGAPLDICVDSVLWTTVFSVDWIFKIDRVILKKIVCKNLGYIE